MNFQIIKAKELKDGSRIVHNTGIWTVWLGDYKYYEEGRISKDINKYGFGRYGYVKIFFIEPGSSRFDEFGVLEHIGNDMILQLCENQPVILLEDNVCKLDVQI
jgi:hypothetical protein